MRSSSHSGLRCGVCCRHSESVRAVEGVLCWELATHPFSNQIFPADEQNVPTVPPESLKII